MKKNAWLAIPLVVLALWAPTILAQATRTWVSGVGDDANPCSRTAPCKTFAGAISKTAGLGEIDAVDPGGFGVLTITKSITLDGSGTHASILASGTVGLNIVAGPNDKVVIRNLSINGSGTTLGTYGIHIQSAGEVIIENVAVFNFSTAGIAVAPVIPGPSPSASPIKVAINRSQIFDNAIGVSVDATAAAATVRLSDTTVTSNTTGLSAAAGGNITSYNNNRLAGNGTDGAPTQTIYQR